jgi:hypothetical protein
MQWDLLTARSVSVNRGDHVPLQLRHFDAPSPSAGPNRQPPGRRRATPDTYIVRIPRSGEHVRLTRRRSIRDRCFGGSPPVSSRSTLLAADGGGDDEVGGRHDEVFEDVLARRVGRWRRSADTARPPRGATLQPVAHPVGVLEPVAGQLGEQPMAGEGHHGRARAAAKHRARAAGRSGSGRGPRCARTWSARRGRRRRHRSGSRPRGARRRWCSSARYHHSTGAHPRSVSSMWRCGPAAPATPSQTSPTRACSASPPPKSLPPPSD